MRTMTAWMASRSRRMVKTRKISSSHLSRRHGGDQQHQTAESSLSQPDCISVRMLH